MKTLMIFLFLLPISFGFAQHFEEGLIVYYQFNENFADSSENHLDGISNATFTEDPFGKENSAIHFNGIDQYLDFPPVQPILKPELPVSFAFWIKFEDVAPFTTLILTTDYAQDKHTGAWVSTTWDGAITCGYGDGTGNGPYSRRSKNCFNVLASDTWYHIIVIIRGPYDISLYVDCVEEEGYYEGDGSYMVYTDCQGSLGRKDSGVGYPPIYFKGAMDEFRFWNRELNADDLEILCTGVNINEKQVPDADKIVLFPNPAENVINIANLPAEVESIEMVDANGKTIMTTVAAEQISIAGLSQGVYYLRFIDENKVAIKSRKFIKE